MSKKGMVRVRIKLMPGTPDPKPATGKVFLPFDKKKGFCRPLEPGEVVSLPEEIAHPLLKKLEFELEITLDPPTRPYYFSNKEDAIMTSADFKPAAYGRAEEAKDTMEAMKKQMAEQALREDTLAAREAEVARREAALNSPVDENDDGEDEGDEGDEDYDGEDEADEMGDEISDEEIQKSHGQAKNNAISQDELDRIRKQALKEEEDLAASQDEQPRRRRRSGRKRA